MELIITLYQDKADHAIDEMLKAWDSYEATKSNHWVEVYHQHEAAAVRYLTLLEGVKTFNTVSELCEGSIAL
ncbi:MAG: hypothetical protein ACRDHW_01765 [Ktedonobacteraceae bacterium]